MTTRASLLIVPFLLLSGSAAIAAGYPPNYEAPASPVRLAPQAAAAANTGTAPLNRQLEDSYHAVWLKLRDSFHDPRALDNWKDWEHRFDGKLNNQSDLDSAIKQMVASVNDRWTSYISYREQAHATRRAMYGGSHIGMLLKRGDDGFRIEMIVHESPVHKSRLRKGDLVVSLNGQDLSKLSQEEVDMMLVGMEGNRLTVATADLPNPVQLTFQRLPAPVVRGRLIDADVVYVHFPDFGGQSRVSEFAQEYARLSAMTGRKVRGLVLDLRHNPGGTTTVAEQMASLTLPEGALVARYIERANGLTRVTHVRAMKDSELSVDGKPIDAGVIAELRQVPIVVLANGSTASAAELLIQALRGNGRATIVGEQTFGKGLGYTITALPNGGILTVTMLMNLGPNMRSHDLTGVTPDVIVAQGRDFADLQLPAALAALRQK